MTRKVQIIHADGTTEDDGPVRVIDALGRVKRRVWGGDGKVSLSGDGLTLETCTEGDDERHLIKWRRPGNDNIDVSLLGRRYYAILPGGAQYLVSADLSARADSSEAAHASLDAYSYGSSQYSYLGVVANGDYSYIRYDTGLHRFLVNGYPKMDISSDLIRTYDVDMELDGQLKANTLSSLGGSTLVIDPPVRLGSNVLVTADSRLSIGTTTPLGAGLTIEGDSERIYVNSRRTFGTGYARNILDMWFENDVQRIQAGALGYLTRVNLGGTPTIDYMYLGAGPDVSHLNNALRITPDNWVEFRDRIILRGMIYQPYNSTVGYHFDRSAAGDGDGEIRIKVRPGSSGIYRIYDGTDNFQIRGSPSAGTIGFTFNSSSVMRSYSDGRLYCTNAFSTNDGSNRWRFFGRSTSGVPSANGYVQVEVDGVSVQIPARIL